MPVTDQNTPFSEGFDFFKWEAPYFKTPEKVVTALHAANVEGKALEGIHVPGVGTDLKGDRFYSGEKRPFSLWFSEPLQLIFQDGTTLEILPLYNGGARVGVNSLPAGVKSGVNQTTWDLKRLLSLTLFQSKLLYRDAFLVEHAQRTTYKAEPSMVCGYLPQKRTEYVYRIFLNDGQTLEMYTEDRGSHSPVQYRLRLLAEGEVVLLPTQQWIAARNKRFSIELMPGVGLSSHIKIFPVYTGGKKRETWSSRKNHLANFALSMDVDECNSFFGVLLRKYFDPAIQNQKEWCCDEAVFDWYGTNIYTMDTAYKLIAEIRELADRMEKDPADPTLKPIVERFVFYDPDHGAYDDEVALHRERLAAIDLYRRFARSLESMLEAASRDGCDAIELFGP